jgi:hypothetical protein
MALAHILEINEKYSQRTGRYKDKPSENFSM